MENSYEQLIDDYKNSILVEAGESLTDYISRMGGVNYPDKKANGGVITALRIGLANGSLDPDELAALKEEVKQNPTMVNEITDIEFGVNKPGPATDQGPYIKFDKKKEEEDMQKELEGESKIDLGYTKPSGEENVPSQRIIDMQIKAIERMIDEGEDNVEKIIFTTGARPGLVDLIIKRKAQSKANGGVAGILKV